MQKHKACMRSRLLQENGPDVALPCFAVIDVTRPSPILFIGMQQAGMSVKELGIGMHFSVKATLKPGM